MMMDTGSKIFVAGHRGLVGSAILRNLQGRGFANLITRGRDELDLSDQAAVRDFFQDVRPDYVFLAAAKVGGIYANNTFPAEFIHQNILIQDNVIHQSWLSGVKRLLFLGSSCIYPRDCPQPMKEEFLLTGPLEPTNRSYAVAKIAGIETCWAYNRQYGTSYLSVMPTNLYGPGDNYDLNNSHVLPALIRKMHEAASSGADRVVLWGTGAPRREFLFSDDMADAAIFIMSLDDIRYSSLLTGKAPPLINIGCGTDLTIAELARLVQDVVGFHGHIEWDSNFPDGTYRKLLDVDKIYSLGWRPKVELRAGIRLAYDDFLKKIRIALHE